jgi:hypothetical protein
MLISAVSRMSVQSNGFTFVDFDAAQTDINNLQGLVGFTDDFVVPNYYIRGAITQLDEGVLDESQAAAIGIPEISVGLSRDQTVSVLSLDLNVGNLVTRQILPGVSAHNSIAVARRGYAGDLAGEISKLGVSFNIVLNKGEGLHQAVRTLIELSTIEVLGKLAEVPYWRCLSIEQTNPAILAEARGWFEAMSDGKRVTFVQEALKSEGYLSESLSGQLDQATKNAIGQYQSDHSLIADGRINFDLYASLISQDLALGRQPGPRPEVIPASLEPNPLTLNLTTPLGQNGNFRLNDALVISASTSQDAYLYCYYGDATGAVARIFPNQYQPDAYITANQRVSIPGQGAGFEIVFETPGAREQVACVASPTEVGLRLPASLKTADLVPMPVGSVDEVVQTFRQLDPATLAEDKIDITIGG